MIARTYSLNKDATSIYRTENLLAEREGRGTEDNLEIKRQDTFS